MLSLRFKKGIWRYRFWIYLYNLFFILKELQKIVSGSVPQIGFLLVWTYLATFVSPAPLTFPSRMAKNHFEMSSDGSYLFFYDTGPGQHQSFREEKRNRGGTISGTYGYVDPIGVLHITEYIADSRGYRASLEVYEPIRQLPERPALIVGPLPADLRSPDERARQQSVFDKYKFPIEPFESLKIDSPRLIYSDVVNKIISPTRTATTTTSTTSIRKFSNKEVFENELEPNGTSLPITDIETLAKQVKSLSSLLEDDSLLLIGPLPGDLPKLMTLNYEDDSFSEASRKLRSLFRHGRKYNETSVSFVNFTDTFNHNKLQRSEYEAVIPSINDLNYVEKELVSKGEDISSFLTYPSSGLLQGGILPPDDERNTPSQETISLGNNKNVSILEEVIQSNNTKTIASPGRMLPSNDIANSPSPKKTFGDSENRSLVKVDIHTGDVETSPLVKRIKSRDDKENNASSEEILEHGPIDSDENLSFGTITSFDVKENFPSIERITPSSDMDISISPGAGGKISFNVTNHGPAHKRMIPSEGKVNISVGEHVRFVGTKNISSSGGTVTTEMINLRGDVETTTLFEETVQPSDTKNSHLLGRMMLSDDTETNSSIAGIRPSDDKGGIISPSDTRDTPFSGRKSKFKKRRFRQKRVKLDISDINSVPRGYISEIIF